MRILTNVSKSELDHLTGQPTAKALIEKVETEGIYIPGRRCKGSCGILSHAGEPEAGHA